MCSELTGIFKATHFYSPFSAISKLSEKKEQRRVTTDKLLIFLPLHNFMHSSCSMFAWEKRERRTMHIPRHFYRSKNRSDGVFEWAWDRDIFPSRFVASWPIELPIYQRGRANSGLWKSRFCTFFTSFSRIFVSFSVPSRQFSPPICVEGSRAPDVYGVFTHRNE